MNLTFCEDDEDVEVFVLVFGFLQVSNCCTYVRGPITREDLGNQYKVPNGSVYA